MAFTSVKKLTFSAILIALGILIPMIMPVKIVIGPASYTLASHVPVFLAMFISPGVAVAVALGTAFGFFLSFPAIIALRALSHVVFAVIGAYILQQKPTIVSSFWQFQAFSAFIALIHGATEFLVVVLFATTGPQTAATYWLFFLTVGVGGFIHSMVDFTIAYYLGERLSRQFDFPVFAHSQMELKQLQSHA